LFAFRLALALGCTVRELLGRLDSQELSEWMAFYSIDPWGDQRGDLRNAMLLAHVVGMMRKRGTMPPHPREFMPFTDRIRYQTPEEQKAFFRVLTRRLSNGEHS
jgi:hypothetical protein